MRIIVLLFCIISINTTLAQQKEITYQSLYWVRYYNQLTINKNWIWHNEIDNRRFFEGNRQHHLIMHSHLHYKFLPTLDAALGFTYSRQSPQDPKSVSELVIPELRPFQEINLTQKLSKRLTIAQRFRLDERFIHQNNGNELLDGYGFNFRFRYRLQANIILGDIQKNRAILKIANETMLNAGPKIILNQFDQNRLSTAVELNINKNLSVELGLIHWYQQRNTGYQFFSRNILRLTVYHKLKLEKE
jgi:Protein of unknown function (DUF2490)